MKARIAEAEKVGPRPVEAGTGFEADSRVAIVVAAIAVLAVLVAAPTTAAANAGSRTVEIEVAKAAAAAEVVVAVPKLVAVGIDPAPTAIGIAEDNPAVLNTPVLVLNSMTAIEADSMAAPAGLAAASRNSVGRVELLRRPAMPQVPRVPYDHCGYAARCRELPRVQSGRE